MVAFPPHLQLAFPVASELALSACTYGLRFGDCFRLQFSSALRFRIYQFRLRAVPFGVRFRFNQTRHFYFH
jgi:hypothetical protein